MSATIHTFPVAETEQRLRLAKSETRDWQMSQILDAIENLSAAQLELMNAANRLHRGGELLDGDPVVCGQTLESILIAVVAQTNLMGASNTNREISRSARLWLQVNGSGGDGC